MRAILWVAASVVMLIVFAHAVNWARLAINKSMASCTQHNAEVADVR